MSAKDGIVHLWDLPEDKVCVRLPDEVQKSMVKKALEIINSKYKLAEVIGIKPVNIYDFEKCRFSTITLSVIRKFSEFLVRNESNGFSLENLEKIVKLIKGKFVGNYIFNPKFPINFNNEEGARIIACVLFDGGITTHLYPFYINNDEFLINRMIKSVQHIIGKLKFNKRHHSQHDSTFQLEFPVTLGYILVNGLGMLPGNKIITNPKIPDFILNGSLEVRKSFLQQAFDDDGTVNKGNKRGAGRAIQLDQYHSSKNEPPIRLTQLKGLLEDFGIPVNGPYGPIVEHTAKNEHRTYGWMIEITNQSDIRKFSESIGFSLPRKQRDLEELLNSYKLPPRFKKGTKFDEILKACRKLKEENQKITNKNIAKKVNKSSHYIAELTFKLVKQGKLKVIKDKTPLKGDIRGFEEKEFELIE